MEIQKTNKSAPDHFPHIFNSERQADSCSKDVDEESDGGRHWKSQICLEKRGLSENTLNHVTVTSVNGNRAFYLQVETGQAELLLTLNALYK